MTEVCKDCGSSETHTPGSRFCRAQQEARKEAEVAKLRSQLARANEVIAAADEMADVLPIGSVLGAAKKQAYRFAREVYRKESGI